MAETLPALPVFAALAEAIVRTVPASKFAGHSLRSGFATSATRHAAAVARSLANLDRASRTAGRNISEFHISAGVGPDGRPLPSTAGGL